MKCTEKTKKGENEPQEWLKEGKEALGFVCVFLKLIAKTRAIMIGVGLVQSSIKYLANVG